MNRSRDIPVTPRAEASFPGINPVDPEAFPARASLSPG